MRILLVEDDPRIVRHVKVSLEAASYAVDVVSDGETAWFEGDTQDYDAVVLAELLARVRALTRRAAGRASAILRAGLVSIDTRKMQATVNDAPVNLTTLEYRCLSYLLHHAGRVVPPGELMERLYAHGHDHDLNAVEVLMGRLRRKLGVELIQTRRGFGYIIPDTAEA